MGQVYLFSQPQGHNYSIRIRSIGLFCREAGVTLLSFAAGEGQCQLSHLSQATKGPLSSSPSHPMEDAGHGHLPPVPLSKGSHKTSLWEIQQEVKISSYIHSQGQRKMNNEQRTCLNSAPVSHYCNIRFPCPWNGATHSRQVLLLST